MKPRLIAAARVAAGLVVSSFAFSGVHAADAVPKGWFIWPSLEPKDGTPLDVSSMNASRGDKLPRISVRDGHFVTPAGERVRFWGCNLPANQAYPATAAEADLIARRLAKAGVNIARLHHLDNPWGIGNGGSIWPKGTPLHRELDSAQLDKLYRLIGALRDHGIYSNLNLKVSKSLVAADGFAESVTRLPDYQKRVDIFDRHMIELQKDYARRLLTTKNPYTGLAPAEDPAVAVVELNNENSLLGYWTRDLGRKLDQLPEPFRGELQSQWNAWLARRYVDDEVLAHSWQPTSSAGMRSLIASSAKWHANVQPGAKAELVPGADATEQEIRVLSTGGTDWHVQVVTAGLPIEDGTVYTLEFLARADHPRKLGVGLSLDLSGRPGETWRSLGLLDTAELQTEWKPVRFVFAAHSAAGSPGSFSFNAGQATGSIWIKNLRLVADAPDAGLRPGQSARAGTVPIPTAPSTRQWADWIAFLADTERAFADEMRDYLKHDLHVQASIICSQIDYGGLTGMNREHAMEFADGHAYWQHPDFGAGMWDPANWSIRNTPQLAEFSDRSFGELGKLALIRVARKPFTVSEYDHPAPSEFACEMYPTLASFACRQDWDIVYPFCIGAYGASNPDGRILDFFDQLNHPAKWGLTPFAAVLFRQGIVPPAPRRAELHLGSPLWAEQPHADVLWQELSEGHVLDFLNTRYAVSDRPGPAGAKAWIAAHAPSVDTRPPVALQAASQGKLYIIATPQAAGVVGYIGGGSADAGALHVSCPRFGRDFASITAVALDGKPMAGSNRVLLTVVARAGNQGTTWNKTRTSFGPNWGHGPTVAESVPATIRLDGKPRTIFLLAPDGSREKPIIAKATADAVSFTVRPADQTLQYEIATR